MENNEGKFITMRKRALMLTKELKKAEEMLSPFCNAQETEEIRECINTFGVFEEEARKGSMEEFIDFHKSLHGFGNFFDDDAMKFFDSKIETDIMNGNLFVTSAQFHGSDGTSGMRVYTIRRANWNNGKVEKATRTMFKTLAAAKSAAVRLHNRESKNY